MGLIIAASVYLAAAEPLMNRPGAQIMARPGMTWHGRSLDSGPPFA